MYRRKSKKLKLILCSEQWEFKCFVFVVFKSISMTCMYLLTLKYFSWYFSSSSSRSGWFLSFVYCAHSHEISALFMVEDFKRSWWEFSENTNKSWNYFSMPWLGHFMSIFLLVWGPRGFLQNTVFSKVFLSFIFT